MHGLPGVLVEAAHNGAFAGLGALRFERTASAGLGIPIFFLLLGLRDPVKVENLSGRATVSIVFCVVGEAIAVKQRLARWVHDLGPGNDGGYVVCLAVLAMLAVGIPRVGKDGEAVRIERIFGLRSHRIKQ